MSSPRIEIYTSMLCPYCHMAKKLLSSKQIPFDEIDVTADPDERARMRKRADGRHTVPQIFINDMGIGGCDDLMALDRNGKLEPLLALQES